MAVTRTVTGVNDGQDMFQDGTNSAYQTTINKIL